MKNTNTRKLIYHLRYRYFTMSNIVVVMALLIGAGWAWASVVVMDRNYTLQKEVDARARQQKIIDLEAQTLAYEQKYYRSNEYLELAARERVGLAAPGEKVLVLPPNSPLAQQVDVEAAPRKVEPDVPASNAQQWITFLFGSRRTE